jgi:epoxyqueuosine reductase
LNPRALHTKILKEIAAEMNFRFIGFSEASFLEEEAPRLERWLKEKRHGEMAYMENHFDKRLDPRLLVDGANSVISLLFNYYTEEKQKDPQAPKISKYAFGEDYHHVIKDQLAEFYERAIEKIGSFNARFFVDSAPVLDKVWAKKSGLGWIGKNSNLITKQQGSFFFIAEIICDLELDYDGPIKDYCGTCNACVEACPTEAIVAPYVVDGSKCISYLTIELKNEILPSSFKGKMDDWMFGCDVCQDVCPWNRFSKPHHEPRFNPNGPLLDLTKKDWLDLSEEVFRELFKNSAVKRTKYKGLKRNLDFLNPE